MSNLDVDYEKLRQRAEEERWSDSAIARQIGISQTAVSKIMGGRVEPRATNLKKICDAIGLSIEDAFVERSSV